ncbi:zinc ABC transporter substrate-binding protein [uncultured Bacteroides sp.]|uniref:metal ABC transporter solute-binding protein, Zn/Mn family n=1 Tax=uncultured Bacteroides sp. TaxID=162156 RepID=UPI00261558A8|nr:zinc ABC transporter substrate-binding protein [uncultured Bacteroides sp.]
MKKYFLFIISLLLFTSCSNNRQEEKLPTLTVTIEPLRYFTEAIAGDKFKVVSIVPEGNNPETYDPTPQQLVALNKSQAYLRIGYIGFEQIWMDKLKANTPDLKIFDTSKGVALMEGTCSHTDNGHNHSHEGVEPHIWNSVKNARIIADNICWALCTLDQANASYYNHRLDSLNRIFDRTEEEIRRVLPEKGTTFLIYHPALSYFARDYGMNQISIEEGGKEPSPAHLQELIRRCKDENARIIFVQKEFDTRNAEIIAKEAGVKIVPINPLNYNWPEEMTGIAKALGNKR